MRSLTKIAPQVESDDLIPSNVREAFRQAQQERPGAVHLELPEDIAREETNVPTTDRSIARRPAADDKAIARAGELIAGTGTPLLLIGAAANRTTTCRMLREFVEQTGIWFVNTQMGKGVINEDHNHFPDSAALSFGDCVHRALDAADLIVNVGLDLVEKPPFFVQAGGRTVIHTNLTSAEVDPVCFPQVDVTGDITNHSACSPIDRRIMDCERRSTFQRQVSRHSYGSESPPSSGT